jgi:hypothetical protein
MAIHQAQLFVSKTQRQFNVLHLGHGIRRVVNALQAFFAALASFAVKNEGNQLRSLNPA